jgi:hypothetical protein
MKNQTNIWLTFTVLICLFVFVGDKISFAQQGAESKVVFKVK